MKKRISARKVHAVLMSLVIIFTSMNLLSAAGRVSASDSSGSSTVDKTLTYSDWEIVDGVFEQGVGYSLTDSSITSLDGYAFEGYINFGGATDASSSYFKIGGSADNAHLAFQLNAYETENLQAVNHFNTSNQNFYQPSGWSNSGEMLVRLTFDETKANTWDVGIYVNDTYVDTMTLTNTALGTKLLLSGNITVRDAEEEETKYKTLTYSDWEIVDGVFEQGVGYSLTDGSITSLDGYAFEGYMNFGGATDASSSYFKIGGSADNAHLAFQLNAYETENLQAVNHFNTSNQNFYQPSGWSNSGEMLIRLTFDETATDTWDVGIYVNGIHIDTMMLTNTALGTKMLLGGNITVRDNFDIAASLDDGGYVVKYDNTKIDGTEYTIGSIYNELGVHIISYTESGTTTTADLIIYKLGDAKVNGELDIYDLARLKCYQADKKTPDKAEKKSADLKTDDVIDGEDASLLRKMLVAADDNEGVSLHYGIGEPSYTLYENSMTAEYVTNDFVAEFAEEFGVDTYRIWVPSMADARSDGNGGYSVTLRQDLVEKLNDLVSKLQEKGVTQIVAMPNNYVIMSDYKNYIGADGKTYSAEEIESGLEVDMVYCDNLAVPNPDTDEETYQKFMDVQQEFYRLLAEAVPGITHFETMNEPENNGSVRPTGYKYKGDNWEKPEGYSDEIIAKICMDYSHAATVGVRLGGNKAKVLAPALTATDAGKTMLNEFYEYIAQQTDSNADNYFQILNWHPYIAICDEGSGMVLATPANWDSSNWADNWVAWQEDMYQIAINAGYEGTPVMFTEMGVTDMGTWEEQTNYDNLDADITELMAAERLTKMFELIETKLDFVDTVIAFRLTDLNDTGLSYTGSYEGNFGMLECLYKVSSGEAALKEIGKAFYQILNDDSTDYSGLTSLLAKYYDEIS